MSESRATNPEPRKYFGTDGVRGTVGAWPITAEFMLKRGWNVKRLKPRPDADEDTLPQAYLEVKVNYETGKTPMIWLVTSRNRTLLNKDSVMLLDVAEIVNVDLMVSPYHWEVNGKTGIKAYLKSIFITLNEDELELKYAHLEELGSNGLQLALEGGNPNEPEDVGEYAEVVEEEPTEAPF